MLQRTYTEFQSAIKYTAALRTRGKSNKCASLYRIPGYRIFASHSGPANLFTPLITPVNASKDIGETIYAVSDCYQLHSGNTGTTNFKKLRLFLLHPGLLDFGGPQRTRKPFHAPYKTCIC